MNYKHKLLIAMSIGFALIYMLMFGHGDCVWINHWGCYLLDCIRTGTLRDFAIICNDRGMPINYSLMSTVITAVWDLPVYIVDVLMHGSFSDNYNFVFYTVWYKVFLLLVSCGVIYYTARIMKSLGATDDRTIKVIVAGFCLSPVFLLGNIGRGQMDLLACFFIVYAYYHALEGNYYRMAFAASMMIVIKGISVIFIMPVFLLLFGKDIVKLIKYAACMFVIPVVNSLLEHLLIKDMHIYLNGMETGVWSHADFFLSYYKLGEASLFLIATVVIWLACFIMSLRGSVTKRELVMMPMLYVFCFMALVRWSFWWGIYALPMICIMAVYIDNDRLYAGLTAMLTVALWIYCLGFFGGDMDCHMLKEGLFVHLFPTDWPNGYLLLILQEHFPIYADHFEYMGIAIVIGVLIAMLYIAIRSLYKRHSAGGIFVSAAYTYLAWGIIIASDAAFVIYSIYFCYFR